MQVTLPEYLWHEMLPLAFWSGRRILFVTAITLSPAPYQTYTAVLLDVKTDISRYATIDTVLGDPLRTPSDCRTLPDPFDPSLSNGWYASEPVAGDFGRDLMENGDQFNGADVETRPNGC